MELIRTALGVHLMFLFPGAKPILTADHRVGNRKVIPSRPPKP